MTHTPTIAVLLAAYNGEAWIAAQFDTILNQKEVAVTIYVSIDSSTDNTEKICAEYAIKYQNIVILAHAGRFGGAAKNFFRLLRDVDFSHFDYVAFADQDDIWYPDKLLRGVTHITQRKLGGYSSNVLAKKWKAMGWCGVDGDLRRQTQCIDHGKGDNHDWKLKAGLQNIQMPPVFDTELQFFQFLGLEYVEPKFRV